ncbi:MAG TPA: hypothetical protein DEA08_39135 [Planctomycetes bacterium]|nr:hypothetical protein [Planctomycetota bacterium]
MLALLALPCSLAWPGSRVASREPAAPALRQAPPAVVSALDVLAGDLRLNARDREELELVTSAARVPLIDGRLAKDLDLRRLHRARAYVRPLWGALDPELLARATDATRPGLWKPCQPERWALQLYDRRCAPRERRELEPLRALLEARLAESLLSFDRAESWRDLARLITLEHRLPPLARHYGGRALPHYDWLQTLRRRLGPPPAEAVPAIEGALGLWLEGRAGWALAAERAELAQLGCLPLEGSGKVEWVEVGPLTQRDLLAAYDEAIRLAGGSLHERWRHRWTLAHAERPFGLQELAYNQRSTLARYLGAQADDERWIRETRRLLRLQSEADHGGWRAINDPYRVNQVFGPGHLRSVPRATPPAATGSRPG